MGSRCGLNSKEGHGNKLDDAAVSQSGQTEGGVLVEQV